MDNKKTFTINKNGSKPVTQADVQTRDKSCTSGGFLWGSRGTQYGCKC